MKASLPGLGAAILLALLAADPALAAVSPSNGATPVSETFQG